MAEEAILLQLIHEIASDQLAIDLEALAYQMGIMDMRQVFLIIEEYIGISDKQITIFMTQENWYEKTQLLLASVIINYAQAHHARFMVPTMNPGMGVILSRSKDPREHMLTALKQFDQVVMAIGKYGNFGSQTPQ